MPWVGWSGQASWRRWELMVRDGRGKRADVWGCGRAPNGGRRSHGETVTSPRACPGCVPALSSVVGCRGWGLPVAWATFCPHCRLSLPSQDASGAGPGESGTWAFSAVVLVGGHPGSLGLTTAAAGFAPSSQLRAPRVCAASGSISLPPPWPPPGAVLVSDDTAPGVGTGPSLPRVPSTQGRL